MDVNNSQTISQNITLRRRAAGLSQQSVAQALNVTRQAVSAWERGLSEPDALSLTRLADLYGCAVDELLRGGARGAASTKPDKKAALAAALGAALLLALVLGEVLLEPSIKEAYHRYYDGGWYYAYVVVLRQLLAAVGGALLTFGCVSLARARIAKAAGTAMTALGALAVSAYAAFAALIFFSDASMPSAVYMPFFYVVSHPSLLGCAGALIGAGATGLARSKNRLITPLNSPRAL